MAQASRGAGPAVSMQTATGHTGTSDYKQKTEAQKLQLYVLSSMTGMVDGSIGGRPSSSGSTLFSTSFLS